MNSTEASLLARLLETFKIEAQEHLKEITASLIELENATPPADHATELEVIYRAAHSLKGGARIVNLSLIEFLCQSVENCMSGIRRGAFPITPDFIDLLHETTGTIENILSSPQPDAPSTAVKSSAMKLRQRFEDSMKNADISMAETKDNEPLRGLQLQTVIPVPDLPACTPINTATSQESVFMERRRTIDSDSVRISSARLDALMLQSEEMVSLKLLMRQQVTRLKEVIDDLALIRRDLAGVDTVEKESVKGVDRSLSNLGCNLAQIRRNSEDDCRQAATLIENLINDAKDLFMFPFSSATEAFQRMVRELAREQGKEIELRLAGEGIEFDRRILQQLKDPLMHILRNCIDHGIETPEERKVLGKPARGLITIGASFIQNSKIEIVIADDGRGINTSQLTNAAVHQGFITEEAANRITADEAMKLAFRSGLSSKIEVTNISGRGLGLAIVSDRVEKLGGVVTIESTPAEGTCFRLLIPLSLATFRGIMIRLGKCIFAVPTLNVENVCRIAPSELGTVGNRQTFLHGKSTIPVIQLAGILGICPDVTDSGTFHTLMLLGTGKECVAYLIDEVIGEEDLLIKALGPQLVRVRNISGATVLGDGTVVPVLNTIDLLKSAMGGHSVQQIPSQETSSSKSALSARRILVVDDSITSRTLLKNVLESYGYDVTTAFDGFEALSVLQSEDIDLVSSDVEMPRMDGFELTARIRSDERFSRLPVVLVTSMDSPEDKKKGINSGADAYIVKSSFDQSNLLDIIRKLI